jgi:gamma-glutamyltranspeptidase/glutathione hydrolase
MCSAFWLSTAVSLLSAAAGQATPACCAAVGSSAPAFQSCGGSRPTGFPFARHSPVLSQRGQVASAHPLASQAGLDILKAGGSAVDAAIATNAVLNVLEPMMNGPGGDLLAIIWSEKDGSLQGYNGAGRSSKTFSYATMAAALADINAQFIPTSGPLAISVPGAPRGWCDLSARYGKLPLATVLGPAIGYASAGAPVPKVIAFEWDLVSNSSAVTSGGRFPHALDGFIQTFTVPDGKGGRRAPMEGEIFSNPALANTLTAIATGGCDAFYKGPIASAIVASAATNGLHLTLDDFASHEGEWVTPINVTYRERYNVFELPPNPQGIAALEMLNILEGFNLSAMSYNSADALHTMIEAKKLAFADAAAFVADPAVVAVPIAGLIDKAYAAQRRALIDAAHAARSDSPGVPPGWRMEDRYGGDTTYLTAADSEGNMVSYIQSLYTGFGSGIVVPSLGFPLQSRGALFAMDATMPNVYAPNKRPYHTLMPSFAFRDGQPWLSFGVMGGFMQPQGVQQIVTNLVDFGMDVQAAGDAARYEHDGSSQPTGQHMTDGGVVTLEAGVCDAVVADLQARGHEVVRGANGGGYQAIMRTPLAGGGFVYAGASEMRKDGLVAAY